MSERYDKYDLVFAIAFALTRRRGELKRIPTHDGIRCLEPAARAVIEHLLRCGWRIERAGSTTPPHSGGAAK